MTRVLLLLGPLAVAAAPLLGVEVLANVRADAYGAEQTADMRTPGPAALELVAPANRSVANGSGLRARAVLRGGGLAECGAAFERCDARVDAWHGEPRLGGKVVKAFSATIHAMPDGGSVEVVADGVACSPGCANECYLTASITSESTVVATSTEPLVVHATAPLRAAGPELADYLAGGQLGDAACSKLAWADPRYRYPDSLCSASSPQVFERIACAYSLGDYLGMPRLALNSGGDYTPAAIADAFPLAQRRAAALAAYGSGSILGRYYARVIAANVGFDWHAHPDASLLKAAFEDWVAVRGDGAPTPIRSEVVVHLRSGDRSRRFVYWDTGNLPFVDAYARLAVRVASNVSATRVSVVAASEFGHADALEAVRDDARDFCAAVRRELNVACARRRGATADEDLAFMARAETLVVHFGGFSATAAVLARGKVVGGPLFALYAAGVRAERKRGGLAADAFSICAPPRAYVDLTFDLANGATTIFAPAHRLDHAARGVGRRFGLGAEAWQTLDAALERRLQTDGAIVGAVVHAAGGPACAADGQSLWPLLDARGFAVVESALDTSPAAREDARARGWTPFDTPAMRNAIAPGDIVVHEIRRSNEEMTAKLTKAFNDWQDTPSIWKFSPATKVDLFEFPETEYKNGQRLLKCDRASSVNADWWDYEGEEDEVKRKIPIAYMPWEDAMIDSGRKCSGLKSKYLEKLKQDVF